MYFSELRKKIFYVNWPLRATLANLQKDRIGLFFFAQKIHRSIHSNKTCCIILVLIKKYDCKGDIFIILHLTYFSKKTQGTKIWRSQPSLIETPSY